MTNLNEKQSATSDTSESWASSSCFFSIWLLLVNIWNEEGRKTKRLLTGWGGGILVDHIKQHVTTLVETSAHVAQCTFVINPQQMSDISLHFSLWHGDFSSRVFLQTKCFHAKQDPFGNKLATLMSRLSGFPSWPPQCYFEPCCSFVRFKVKAVFRYFRNSHPTRVHQSLENQHAERHLSWASRRTRHPYISIKSGKGQKRSYLGAQIWELARSSTNSLFATSWSCWNLLRFGLKVSWVFWPEPCLSLARPQLVLHSVVRFGWAHIPQLQFTPAHSEDSMCTMQRQHNKPPTWHRRVKHDPLTLVSLLDKTF